MRQLVLIMGVIAASAGLSTRADSPARDMSAFKPESRILFQGDSITDGNRGRNADPNHIMGHGVFELWCISQAAEQKWKLEFSVRQEG